MNDITSSFAPGLFEGRCVIVSGGSSGIGLAIAEGFAALGAQVDVTGSSAEKLRREAARLATAHGGRLHFAPLDVRDADAVAAFMQARPSIDVLVNAQGIARPEDEWREDVFLEVMDVNVHSAFRLTMAALPALRAARGSVVNIASMLSYLADAEVPAYTASKTGVLGLTRSLAHRFGPDGVRVNAVAPGYHRTEMTRPLWSEPASEARIAQRTALKRWGSAQDLVGTVLFLCTPAAAYVTGAVLPVDGGYHTG